MPDFTPENHSLVAQKLTPEIYAALKEIKTPHDFTLDQAINSALLNPDSAIGIYAGDEASYTLFSPIFEPIIEAYHGVKADQGHPSDLDITHLDLTPLSDTSPIMSTRIRVGRNLKGFALGAATTKKERLQIETVIKTALLQLTGELQGDYYPLDGMSTEVQQQLIQDHFLFKKGDRFLEAAGLNRDWPSGRGIFHNHNKSFLVWVNEEDELRIISMQEGGDIKAVFKRLVEALETLQEALEFAYSNRLGYIASCPTNLGTSMRASVHIELPKLAQKRTLMQEICEQHHLQIRGIHGEHSDEGGLVFDISNKRRLGISEVRCVQDLIDGVAALIAAEAKA